MKRSILLTLISEAIALLATVWLTRQIALHHPTDLVAEYLVLRQVLNWVLGVGLFGLNIALPQALAGDRRPEVQRAKILASLMVAAPALSLLVLGALVPSQHLALALVHNAARQPLLRAGCLLIAGNGLFTVLAAALQGLERFGSLAVARIAAFALVPTLAVAIHPSSIPALLGSWAWGTWMVDLLMALRIAASLKPTKSAQPLPIGRIGRELFRYGALRMMGAIAQLSTVALAPSLALWSGASAREAGALSVAAMFGVLLGPIRLALQPVALTQLARRPPLREARLIAQNFVAAAAAIATVAGVALTSLAGVLVALWLGSHFAGTESALSLSVAAVVLQFFCYTLEGVLDADDPQKERPRAQLLAAGLFVIAALVGIEARAGAAGVLLAQLCTSIGLTALYLRQITNRYGLPQARSIPSLLLGIATLQKIHHRSRP